MGRTVPRIAEETGVAILAARCGACAAACHEGAIAMVDGKARLTRADYCVG